MCQHKPTDPAFLFFLIAFEVLVMKDKHDKPYTSLHSVWSGFNAAFTEYFPERNPVSEMDRLMRDGLLWIMPAKGGVNLQRRREAPMSVDEARAAEPMQAFLQSFKERRSGKMTRSAERAKLLEQAAAALTVAGQSDAGKRLVELFGNKPKTP